MRQSPDAIITPLDYVFEDKIGREITFKLIEDSEVPNRGFRVDELVAYAGDEKVGYLKALYVSSKTFKKFYPSGLLNYLDQIGGICLFEVGEGYDKPGTDLKTASAETLNKVAANLRSYRFVINAPKEPLKSYSDFQEWFKREVVPTEKYASKLRDYREFKKRIDAPFVDYINTSRSEYNDVFTDNRRLGIGGILYKIMAKELDKRGMRLRSSSLQQPEAKAAWKRMTDEGITVKSRTHKGCYVIDPNTFELELHSTLGMRP